MCVLYFPDGINAIKLKLDVCIVSFFSMGVDVSEHEGNPSVILK